MKTLEKAIKTLNGLTKGWPSVRQFDQLQAIKLGIEGLKAIKLHRRDFRKGDIYRLPGETDELIDEGEQ